MRIWKSFLIKEKVLFRNKLLQFSQMHSTSLFLDSCNNLVYGKSEFQFLAACGAMQEIVSDAGSAFETCKTCYEEQCDWMFGYFGYALKNEVEELQKDKRPVVDFPDLFFFQPEILIICKEDFSIEIGMHSKNHEMIFEEISAMSHVDFSEYKTNKPVHLKATVTKEKYISNVKQLQKHISDGDLYEINYCMQFIADDAYINPAYVFDTLCKKSEAPFSALLKYETKFLISASPERFLKKKGSKLISQPIKGTEKRSDDLSEDALLKEKLQGSEKDRAENIMITDLVRNDLAKSAEIGTVKVEELFGIYSFKQVHQMVSTISSLLREDVNMFDAIKYAFPMGSMTGAPKKIAMELIQKYETSSRGLFSGAVGYVDESGDFDFNVVIRSILYDLEKNDISVHAGSAIVYDSIPEDEYEECILKIAMIKKLLAENK